MEYMIGTKVFGDWEITREIGEGSYGKVYELKKEQFGVATKAAMKMIRIPKTVSEIREAMSDGMDEKSVTSYFKGIVQQFVKEIAVMSELKGHPCIVGCEDFVVTPHEGTIGWDILIRMELLTPMQEYELQHRMEEKQVKKLAMDMCEALMFCQKRGLIHRDIKPGNIFVDAAGNFRLGDFGVARTAEKTMGGMSKQGTENYMAPEVYYVRPYGANVDIYSLGIVLYRMMNGNRLPFWPLPPMPVGFTDKINALTKRMEGAQIPKPLYASDAFSNIILKACEADPKKRYRTAAEMLADLKRLEDQSEIEAKEEVAHSNYEEVEDGTLNIWSNQEVSEDTVNIEDITINPFGDVFENALEEDQDSTLNLFGNRSDNMQEDAGDITLNIFDGKPKAEEVREPVQVPVENEVREERDVQKEVSEYWMQHMEELWGRKLKHWKSYAAPNIPVQHLSNAVLNIAANEIRAKNIIAILDCCFTAEIPCGEGIVITKDKIYINFIQEGISNKITPNAVIDLSVLEDMNVETKKKFLGTQYSLCWTESGNGVPKRYDNSKLSSLNLEQLVRHIKTVAKML